jgi:hypothetical protein
MNSIHWCVGALCQAESFGPISGPRRLSVRLYALSVPRDSGSRLAKSRRKAALWGETLPCARL